MISLDLEVTPMAAQIAFEGERLVVNLADGRALVVPLEWYPRLKHGTADERGHWRLLGGGEAIEWPDLDEHIGIQSLLAGRRSGEASKSLGCWLAARA